jgi:hypothetical protein
VSSRVTSRAFLGRARSIRYGLGLALLCDDPTRVLEPGTPRLPGPLPRLSLPLIDDGPDGTPEAFCNASITLLALVDNPPGWITLTIGSAPEMSTNRRTLWRRLQSRAQKCQYGDL